MIHTQVPHYPVHSCLRDWLWLFWLCNMISVHDASGKGFCIWINLSLGKLSSSFSTKISDTVRCFSRMDSCKMFWQLYWFHTCLGTFARKKHCGFCVYPFSYERETEIRIGMFSFLWHCLKQAETKYIYLLYLNDIQFNLNKRLTCTIT